MSEDKEASNTLIEYKLNELYMSVTNTVGVSDSISKIRQFYGQEKAVLLRQRGGERKCSIIKTLRDPGSECTQI
jgi:hypothetical protein